MIISKNSWHYKAIDRFGTRGAKEKFMFGCHTTCSYIRATIWASIMAVVFGVFMVGFTASLVGMVVSMIAAPIQYMMGIAFVKATWTGAAYVFGTCAWGVVGVMSLIFLVAYLADQYQKRQPSAREKADLIKQAYQDKKDGVCTLVKVAD